MFTQRTFRVLSYVLIFSLYESQFAFGTEATDVESSGNSQPHSVKKIDLSAIPAHLAPPPSVIKYAESRKNIPLMYDQENDVYYQERDKNENPGF